MLKYEVPSTWFLENKRGHSGRCPLSVIFGRKVPLNAKCTKLEGLGFYRAHSKRSTK